MILVCLMRAHKKSTAIVEPRNDGLVAPTPLYVGLRIHTVTSLDSDAKVYLMASRFLRAWRSPHASGGVPRHPVYHDHVGYATLGNLHCPITLRRQAA